MTFNLNNSISKDLSLLQRPLDDVVVILRAAFECLCTDVTSHSDIIGKLANKFDGNIKITEIQKTIEALIALLIDVSRHNSTKTQVQRAVRDAGIIKDDDVLEVFGQFITSKRDFIEGSIKSANIRAYRLVNLEWRLEVKLASRCLLQQSNLQVTMKLYLHTEPKNENRNLLEDGVNKEKIINVNDKRNRKDIVVQTDINSLLHIINKLEEALNESRSRRIRNIVDALH